jgi:hypothetical protein
MSAPDWRLVLFYFLMCAAGYCLRRAWDSYKELNK